MVSSGWHDGYQALAGIWNDRIQESEHMKNEGLHNVMYSYYIATYDEILTIGLIQMHTTTIKAF